jgi:hypothetical protein
MKTFRIITRIAAVTAALCPLWTSNLRADGGTPGTAARTRIDSAFGKLPLQFEANQGQQPAQVKFLSRGQDYTVFLTPDGATLSLRKVRREVRIDKPGPPVFEPKLEAAANLRLRLEGCNPAVTLTGADPLPGAVNYFIGKDRAKWRTNVTAYSAVRYAQVYLASTWFSTAIGGSLNTISYWHRGPLRTPSGCPWRAPTVPPSIRLPAIWSCRRRARRSVSTSR